MFGFRKKVSAAQFGQGLAQLLAGIVDDGPRPDPMIGSIDAPILARESVYLVAWVLDYAVWLCEQDEHIRAEVLDAYYADLKVAFLRDPSVLGSLELFAERALSYTDAVRNPIETVDRVGGEKRPDVPWTVGRTFAGACGNDSELGLITWAGMTYVNTVKSCQSLFNRWRPS